MHMQNLVKFSQFVLKILSRNEILTPIKGHNSVTTWWKLRRNNSNLDLVNINAYVKYGRIPLICSQDIERKRNSDINSVITLWKLTCNNPNLDVVKINAYAKFGQKPSSHLKILSGNTILTSSKGHNAVSIWWKLTRNNPNLELVNINTYVKLIEHH